MRLLVGGCWVEVGRRLRRRLKKHPVRFDSASFNEREEGQTDRQTDRGSQEKKKRKKKKRKEKKRKRVIEEARETDRRMQIQYVLCRQHSTKNRLKIMAMSIQQTSQAGLSLNRGRSFQIEDCPSWGIQERRK